MTVDLATLNLKVDATEVERGVSQLDRLAATGARTEASTDRMGRAFVKAGSEAGRLRMQEAALEAEVQRLIVAQERAALTARAQGIAQERMGQQVNRATGGMRAGMQQLSYQIGDVSTMFALGARPAQIFGSQIGQVTQAVSLMAGGTSRFAAFLGGPWGIAVMSAVTVLGTLGAQMLATADNADTALSRLDAALSRFRSSLSQASDLSQAMTVATRERVGLLTELGRLQREEARLGQGAVGNGASGAALSGQAGRASVVRDRIAAIEDEIGAIDSRMETAMSESRIQAQIDARRVVSEGRTTAATTDSTRALAEERRELEQRVTAANSYIAGLEEEYARLTMSEEAFRARAVAMERAEAVTDDQRAAIDRLAASIAALRAEEELRASTVVRQEKEDEAQQYHIDKIKEAGEIERQLAEDRMTDLADLYETLFTDGVDGVWDVFKKQGLAAISQIAAQWTLALLSGQSGSAGGNPMQAIASIFGGGAANDNGAAGAATSLSGVVSNLFGGGTAGGAGAMANPIASAIAAVPGLNVAIAAAAVTHVVGEGIEKLTGLRFDAAAGIFGLLPGFAVGALKGAVKGGANIGADGGSLGITGSFGKKKFQDAAVSDAGSILDTISQLADALGTTVNAALGGVTIGTRNGKYRVDPTGMGNLSTGKGAIDFGKDQEAAIAYAIRDLINDGILGPISEASKRILEAGGDLEAAIKKAVLIESVPKLLKERLDPLGFALDTIDEQFQELADALREGGATAQQYADAEKLYKLEREAAIEQFGTASRTLTEYLQSLAFGSNSPLSVRQQLTAAEAAFAPFESAIRNGQTIDQDQFTAAANSLLGLSRAANASSAGYFSTYDRIRDLTSQAITNVGTSVPGEGGVVFQQQTATNTQSIARMMEDQNALLRSIDSKLANDNAVTGSTFIGSGRGFAA